MGPLYARSEFSLLQSLLRVNEYVNQCAEYGYTYATISDFNVLFGAKAFDNACKKAHIKALYGMEFSISDAMGNYQFEAIAKNKEGYLQLAALSKAANLDALTLDYLSSLNQCVLIAFNEGGIFEQCIINENIDHFNQIYDSLVKYHPTDLYLGLSYQQTKYWARLNQVAYHFANKVGLTCIPLNKTRYLAKQQVDAYFVINAIKQDKTINDVTLVKDPYCYLLSLDEYQSLYSQELLDNQKKVVDSIHFDLDELTTTLPSYPLKDGIDAKTYLKALSTKGLAKRFANKEIPSEYITRLNYELDVIDSMGFNDYFLIVYDYILYAKKNGIHVGPGRGSAAGSLVSYSIGITEIDPIQYHLLFERFLNPARSSMPDIDTDFPDNRRDEVIQYVVDKYGKDHVGHILTFGTLAAKQVVRDVAKALGMGNHEIERITRCIPTSNKMTLDIAIKESAALRQLIYDDSKVKSVIELAKQLEGLPRHCSTHAGGIVFSKKPFGQCVPTIDLDQSMATTQYTMEYLEPMGLIKMDFLGLKNLTILDDIVTSIKRVHPTFSLNQIPLNDPKTLQLIAKADTIGVFQLESEGMKSLLKRLKPETFLDVVAAIALFRPGPMELIPLYIKNRQSYNKGHSSNPAIAAILDETYGVMVYQEQVMQISQVIAKFSLAQADILRKAMSKKKVDQLHSLQQEFIKGAIDNGYTQQQASQWFESIDKFSGYGFNKAHSVAYGLIAYQLAYLKMNAPLAFYCAYLNSIIGANAKVALVLNELRSRHIKVYGPSINCVSLSFTVNKQGLRFPLIAIKGIGTMVAKSIYQDYQNYGPFTSYFNAVARLIAVKCNQGQIEMLIDAGAFDEFNTNRYSLKLSLPSAIKYADLIRTINPDGSYMLNEDLVSQPVMIVASEEIFQKAYNECNALGVFLTVNPYASLKDKYHLECDLLADIVTKPNGFYNGFGRINRIKQHRTKKGDLMAFINVTDESGSIDASIMPNLYQQLNGRIKEKSYCEMVLKVEQGKGIIVNRCKLIE